MQSGEQRENWMKRKLTTLNCTNKHTTSRYNGSIRSKEKEEKNIWRSSSWNYSNLVLKKKLIHTSGSSTISKYEKHRDHPKHIIIKMLKDKKKIGN